jgi:hypothetical protein
MFSDISIIAVLDILAVVPAKVKDDMTAIRTILLRMI